MNPNLNAVLKIAIIMTGKTQGRIARLSRITPVKLSRCIHGYAHPTPAERARLARTLGRTEIELFGAGLWPAPASTLRCSRRNHD